MDGDRPAMRQALAVLPDLPSALTAHTVRTVWTLRRSRSTRRPQSLESHEEAPAPDSSRQDLPLRLEAKMRSPER